MTVPRVSIILPVYNGENYVRYAIESVLAQTYKDFELVILDNASMDATEQLCRCYAERDDRIQYTRHARNLGASKNHILGFQMARGEYVKHIAHDDVWEPTLLEKSVKVLDDHPGAILVYPKTRLIDENGRPIEDFDPKLDFSSNRARDRIRSCVWGRHRAYPIFGLARRCAMAKTKYLQPFVDSDRVWLARLALQAPLYEIPEYLFFSRMHGMRYGSLANLPSVQLMWFDPKKTRKVVFPCVRLYFEYLWAVLQARLPLAEKVACLYVVATCFRERWWRSKLKDDLIRPFTRVVRNFTDAPNADGREAVQSTLSDFRR
jgi:glycosyltransferase involved in cell wall biosynthesis